MIVKDINISNGKIEFENVDLDFSNCGIYLINGENGSGKTLLLRTIVFGKSGNVSFKTKIQEEEYKKRKESVFSYLAQNVIKYQCSVKDYIFKGFAPCDTELARNYMNELGIGYLDFAESVIRLSSGELMKLSIISILIRDTPYIFLDEPTNHLDDQSTNKLICLLRELKDRKTIVIVSHDKRMENAFGCTVCIKNNSVEQKIMGIVRPMNEGHPGTLLLNVNYWRKKILSSLNLFAVLLILIVASAFLISYNESMFSDGYSFDECSYSDDIIHTYKAECEYTDTNKRYVDKNHIEIQGDTDKMISSEEDVKLISESQYVEEILLFDEETFYDTINADTKTETVAIPDFFIRDYLNQTYDGGELIGEIVEGRYPEDYKNEIALSKNSSVLDKYEGQIGELINYWGGNM